MLRTPSLPPDKHLTTSHRDTEGFTVMVPAEIGADLGTDYDWQLHTAQQEFLDGHTVTLNQGKVLGGGTILNGMVWTRSSSRDYDVWADLNDQQSSGQAPEYTWRWADLLPYFEKVSESQGRRVVARDENSQIC